MERGTWWYVILVDHHIVDVGAFSIFVEERQSAWFSCFFSGVVIVSSWVCNFEFIVVSILVIMKERINYLKSI